MAEEITQLATSLIFQPASHSSIRAEKEKEKTIRNAQELLLGVSMMSRIFRVSNYLYYC